MNRRRTTPMPSLRRLIFEDRLGQASLRSNCGRAVGYDGGMDENPYKSPAQDFMAELRIKRRRRKLINVALTLGLFIVLFVAYWGIRALFVVLNGRLLGPR